MTTPNIHTGTPPKGLSHIAENYTQSQIESAIVAMMANMSPVGTYDRAQAGLIAQMISPHVNHPVTGIPPGSNLTGNMEFVRMVMDKAPKLAAEASDPATRAALERLAAQQNFSAAGAFAQSNSLDMPKSLWASERGGSNGRGSSARFDDMPVSSTGNHWGTEKGMAEMRSLAYEKGLGWMANNPEILRLGPAAVESFAKVKMQQETYEKLTKKIGFTDREAVKEVEYYLKTGGDPAKHKEHVDQMEKNLLGLTGGDPDAMRRAKEALVQLNETAGRTTEADKQTFNKAIDEIAGGDPAKQQAGQALQRQVKTISDETQNKIDKDKSASAAAESVFGGTAEKPSASEAPAVTPSKDNKPPTVGAEGKGAEGKPAATEKPAPPAKDKQPVAAPSAPGPN